MCVCLRACVSVRYGFDTFIYLLNIFHLYYLKYEVLSQREFYKNNERER